MNYSIFNNILDKEYEKHNKYMDYIHEAENYAEMYNIAISHIFNNNTTFYTEEKVNTLNTIVFSILNNTTDQLSLNEIVEKFKKDKGLQDTVKNRILQALNTTKQFKDKDDKEKEKVVDNYTKRLLNNEPKEWLNKIKSLSKEDLQLTIKKYNLNITNIFKSIDPNDKQLKEVFVKYIDYFQDELSEFLKIDVEELKQLSYEEIIKKINTTEGEIIQKEIQELSNPSEIYKRLVNTDVGKYLIDNLFQTIKKVSTSKDFDQIIQDFKTNKMGTGALGEVAGGLSKRNTEMLHAQRATIFHIAIESFLSTLLTATGENKTEEKKTSNENTMHAILRDINKRDVFYNESSIFAIQEGAFATMFKWASKKIDVYNDFKSLKNNKITSFAELTKNEAIFNKMLLNIFNKDKTALNKVLKTLDSDLKEKWNTLSDILDNKQISTHTIDKALGMIKIRVLSPKHLEEILQKYFGNIKVKSGVKAANKVKKLMSKKSDRQENELE